jgi:hypothetical protein
MCDYSESCARSAAHSCDIRTVLAVRAMGYADSYICHMYEVLLMSMVQLLASVLTAMRC